MMQTRMLKFRLYPNKVQRQVLEQILEDCRHVYNQLLAIHRSVYKETGRTMSQYDLNRKLTELKHASWGKFLQMLSYKAEGAGGRLVKVNPRNTSRIHKHGELDRDYNASLNTLERGLSGQGTVL